MLRCPSVSDGAANGGWRLEHLRCFSEVLVRNRSSSPARRNWEVSGELELVAMEEGVIQTPEEGTTFVVSTPLYYVNAAPHMCSAYPTIATDALARFQMNMVRRLPLQLLLKDANRKSTVILWPMSTKLGRKRWGFHMIDLSEQRRSTMREFWMNSTAES